MNNSSNIEAALKTYILSEFLAGEDPAQLTYTTPLVTSGVLDSLATLKIVSYLEQEFSITLEAHEVDAENFDTIEKLTQLILSKKS